MKRIVTIVVLICAVAFPIHAQNNGEEQKKAAEQAVKLADKNPTDGRKQFVAAGKLIDLAISTDRNYDRALTYAHKALEIAQKQQEQKDTLLADSYAMLGNIYLMQGSTDNACDFMELAVEALDKQLGRYDPLTIFNRLRTGMTITTIYPDTRRGFLNVMQAFYDNDKAPANKRIKNMDQMNICFSMTMEQMLTAYTNSNRYAIPVIVANGERHYLVQTRDWHIGQPLVNWLSPSMLRSEAERKAQSGKNVIVMNDKGELRRLSEEEGKNLMLNIPKYGFNNSKHELEIAPDAPFLWYLQPQLYNDTVKRYEEFVNKK